MAAAVLRLRLEGRSGRSFREVVHGAKRPIRGDEEREGAVATEKLPSLGLTASLRERESRVHSPTTASASTILPTRRRTGGRAGSSWL